VMFDTGSSAFALLTDEATWQTLRTPDAASDSFAVKSWDAQLVAHNAPSRASIRFADQELALNEVSYIEGVGWFKSMMMRVSGMGGMTGNKLFTQHRLILDPVNERYWLLPAQNN